MRIATIRNAKGTSAVRIDGSIAVEIPVSDIGSLLADPNWRQLVEQANGPTHPVETLEYAPLVPRPSKILCVGLNYRSHILEMGREVPIYPTLFAKFTESLIGANDDLILPSTSTSFDWEAELAIVISEPARLVALENAHKHIGGYAVLNDVTARDWQYRTTQWLQGKTFEGTCPFGPHLVTLDELPDDMEIACEIDGEVVQSSKLSDLVFSPEFLVHYISQFITLLPGDVIATGTPGGVGHARKPPRYLKSGQRMVTRINGVGTLSNLIKNSI